MANVANSASVMTSAANKRADSTSEYCRRAWMFSSVAGMSSGFMAKALSGDGEWNLHSRKVSFVARSRAARVVSQTHRHTHGSLSVIPVLACTKFTPVAPNVPIHSKE